MMEQIYFTQADTIGDEDVTDGSVENFDFEWGDPVETPERSISSGCPGGRGRQPY